MGLRPNDFGETGRLPLPRVQAPAKLALTNTGLRITLTTIEKMAPKAKAPNGQIAVLRSAA
jgi:hypothetical protein